MTSPLTRAVLFLALTALARGQASLLTPGTSSAVGIDPAALTTAARMFERAVANDDLKGAVVLVACRDKIVFHEAYGFRDPARKNAMRKDSLFRMASNSKAVTAAAILALVDDGKLELDDPVAKHMPSFGNEESRAITIRHLLTHTSGLRIPTLFLRPLMEPSPEHPKAPTLQLEAARFGTVGPEAEPGTTYAYNNPGYNTLAALIEVASGEDYRAFVRRRFYQPLGMKDSCNHESEADHYRMSTVFRRRGADWRQGWKPGDPPDLPFPRGSGGMISTAADFASFCRLFLEHGRTPTARLLSPAAVRLATRSWTSHIDGAPGYGFGWRIEEHGVFSHGGSDGTWAWVDPAREIIGVVLTQSPGGANPRQAFRDAVTAAFRGRPKL